MALWLTGLVRIVHVTAAPRLKAKPSRLKVTAATLFVAVAFLGLFAFFDLINEMGDLGKGAYRFQHALAFVALSMPAHVYELAPVAARDDELGVLARVLHNAVVEVRAREALAASRITALRADIRASGETAVLSDDDLAEFGILTPGVVIGGRFEIVRLIGRGGWATVYEANDRELGERVALPRGGGEVLTSVSPVQSERGCCESSPT